MVLVPLGPMLRPDTFEAKRDPRARRRAWGQCSVLDREGWCRGCESDRATDSPPRHRGPQVVTADGRRFELERVTG